MLFAALYMGGILFTEESTNRRSKEICGFIHQMVDGK